MIGTFTKNTAITFIVKIFSFLVTALVSIIISRTLGPEQRGIYSLIILLPSLLLLFFEFGITPATVFHVGKNKYDVRQILGNSLFLSTVFSLLSIPTGLLVILLLRKSFFIGVPTYYLIIGVALYLPINIFFWYPSVILLGKQKIGTFNLALFVSTLFSLLTVVIFVRMLRWGIFGAILASIVAAFISGLLLLVLVIREVGAISWKLNKQYLKDVLSYGIKSHISNLFATFHPQINILLISFYMNPLAVGLFSIADGAVQQLQTPAQSAITVLFPKVLAESDEKKKTFTPLVCRNIIFITLMQSLILFVAARWLIVLVYSNRFLGSVAPFMILMPAVVAFSGSYVLSTDFLARGRPMLSTYTNSTAFLVNIILSVLLIPPFGITGAAVAMTFSYIFLFIINMVVYVKVSHNRFRDVFLLKWSDLVFYKNFIIYCYDFLMKMTKIK